LRWRNAIFKPECYEMSDSQWRLGFGRNLLKKKQAGRKCGPPTGLLPLVKR